MQFIECITPLRTARTVILGFPYDGTSSFRPGSRFAPNSIRESSYGLESYSPYLKRELKDKRILDCGDIELPFGEKDRVLKEIGDLVRSYLKKKKKIFSLGGEHLISYPIIREHLNIYSDLVVLHLDAHADLRDEYLGEKYSHATVMRRVYDCIEEMKEMEEMEETKGTRERNYQRGEVLKPKKSPQKRIYQFGIRSGTEEEWLFAQTHLHFYPFGLEFFAKIISSIPKELPLYLTLDLDILDTSVLPGTGTPEPGGVSFSELLSALLCLKGKNLVGADLVELCPDYDSTKVSSIVSAKLAREILLLL